MKKTMEFSTSNTSWQLFVYQEIFWKMGVRTH